MAIKSGTGDEISRVQLESLLRLQRAGESLPLRAGNIHARNAGGYLSPFKGRGMEFDETRRYEPGDDVRNIDWRVTARTAKVHTKLFREERERPVLLWLDLRQPMFFATHGAFKAVVAAQAAGLLAWSAVAHRDRLGGLIFSEDQHLELRPMNGRSAVLRFLQSTCRHPVWEQPEQRAEISASESSRQALLRLRNVAHPGSLIFLISDFRGFDTDIERHIGAIARHNDVVLVHVSDPLERELPPAGRYRLRDGNRDLAIDSGSAAVREQHRQRFAQHCEFLQSLCRRFGMFYLPCGTDEDPVQTLQAGLGLRRR